MIIPDSCDEDESYVNYSNEEVDLNAEDLYYIVISDSSDNEEAFMKNAFESEEDIEYPEMKFRLNELENGENVEYTETKFRPNKEAANEFENHKEMKNLEIRLESNSSNTDLQYEHQLPSSSLFEYEDRKPTGVMSDIALFCSTCSYIIEQIPETTDSCSSEKCRECLKPFEYQCQKCSSNFDSIDLCKQHQSNTYCNQDSIQTRSNRNFKFCLKCHSKIYSEDADNHHDNCRLPWPKSLEKTDKIPNSESFMEFHEEYNCDECGISVTSKAKLRNHIIAKHIFENCPSCGKLFSNLYLPYHAKKCGQLPNHECPHCAFRTTTTAYLKSHIKNMHENNEGFTCSACGNNFKARRYLAYHKKHVCQKTRQNTYRCHHCDYKGRCRNYLLKHMLSMHCWLYPHNEYQCDICGEILHYKRHIARHMEKHTSKDIKNQRKQILED